MMSHSSQIESLVMEVRQTIPTILASMEADGYLKANVEEGEGNVVVIIVGLKPITPSFPHGINVPEALDGLYSLIKRAVLDEAKEYGIEVRPFRKNW